MTGERLVLIKRWTWFARSIVGALVAGLVVLAWPFGRRDA